MAGQKKVTEEENDSNVITDSYDKNEEGEVEPSEDELTNVQYSETDNHEKAPLPGPSRVPATPIKSNQTETKAKKKKISPIKYPEATPKKNSEDLPLSKLITPRRPRSDARQDLRKRLDMVPIFTEPKLHRDRGPMETRVGRDLVGPWLPGSGPKGGNAHRNRPFIARNLTWSNQEAAGSNEEEEKRVRGHDATSDETGDIDSDGVDDPNNTQRK